MGLDVLVPRGVKLTRTLVPLNQVPQLNTSINNLGSLNYQK